VAARGEAASKGEEQRMPRRKVAEKREVLPDPVFGQKLVTKFVNAMMRKGKRSTAERIFYGAMGVIEDRTKMDPQKLFKQAVDNVKPVLEVKSRRVGGATYQVPVEVRAERRTSLALRWIIGFAHKRTEKTMRERLAAELIEAANNRGASVKKREDTHKMAEANKAFAHYRW
jgi:small subunit ribosomal protein S7